MGPNSSDFDDFWTGLYSFLRGFRIWPPNGPKGPTKAQKIQKMLQMALPLAGLGWDRPRRPIVAKVMGWGDGGCPAGQKVVHYDGNVFFGAYGARLVKSSLWLYKLYHTFQMYEQGKNAKPTLYYFGASH